MSLTLARRITGAGIQIRAYRATFVTESVLYQVMTNLNIFNERGGSEKNLKPTPWVATTPRDWIQIDRDIHEHLHSSRGLGLQWNFYRRRFTLKIGHPSLLAGNFGWFSPSQSEDENACCDKEEQRIDPLSRHHQLQQNDLCASITICQRASKLLYWRLVATVAMRLNQSSVRRDIGIWANCAACMVTARFVKIMKLDVLKPGIV